MFPRFIIAQVGMNYRRSRIEGCFFVDDDRKFFIFDDDQLPGILCLCTGLSDDHNNRLTVPANPVDCHRMLWLGLHVFENLQCANPGACAHLGELTSRHYQFNARGIFCSLYIDVQYFGVCIRAADEGRMQCPGRRDIICVASSTSHRAFCTRPWEGASYIRIRPVIRMNKAHRIQPPSRSLLIDSMASTIAW